MDCVCPAWFDAIVVSGGYSGQWCLACDQQFASLTGQVVGSVLTDVPLSLVSIIWYRPNSGDAVWLGR